MTNNYQHKYIWLEPCGDECGPDGLSDNRMWCEDENVLGKCERCGRHPVLYKIVSDRTQRRLKNKGYLK